MTGDQQRTQATPPTTAEVIDYLRDYYRQGYAAMNRNGDNILNASDIQPNQAPEVRALLSSANIDLARFDEALRQPLTQFVEGFDNRSQRPSLQPRSQQHFHRACSAR